MLAGRSRLIVDAGRVGPAVGRRVGDAKNDLGRRLVAGRATAAA